MPTDDVKLNDRATISFAPLDQAQVLLTSRDNFIRRLSPFDRAARVKVERDVSEPEFLEFLAGSVLEWQSDEIARVRRALESLRPKLARFALDFPTTIWMIKTTGLEEGQSAYTRSNAIILPPAKLGYPDPGKFERLIIHELFHVLSRHNPRLRESLYSVVGFRPCGEVDFPPELADRKITNPDAPLNDYAIRVSFKDEALWGMPILYARHKYDARQGGEHFEYMVLRLLAIQRDGIRFKPVYREGRPVCLEIDQVSQFFEQVGRNTERVEHPEEILASNFTLLVDGAKDVPSPGILDRMAKMIDQERERP